MGHTSLKRDRVEEYARRFPEAPVAVLGDLMLDRYFWGDADRISPEAPVPVVHVTRRSARLGGAANVAANLRALGCPVSLFGTLGDDREAEEVRALLTDAGIDDAGVIELPDHETTEKVRIIARHQQVVRADFETVNPLGESYRRKLFDRLAGDPGAFAALVISDYGKGVIAEDYLREIVTVYRRAGKPVLVDPNVAHFAWYGGASVITPNAREFQNATGVSTQSPTFSADAFAVRERMGLEALLITRGEHGMSLFHGEREETHIPTEAREVFDVTGAGDTVIGVLGAALAAGAGIVDAVMIANRAAGEVVREVGTSTITAEELVGAFS